MAKRLHPHRRLLARQAALKHAVQVEHGRDADVGLQQGRVRSSLARGTRPKNRVAPELVKYAVRPHSKFGDEPPERPVIPGSQKLGRH